MKIYSLMRNAAFFSFLILFFTNCSKDSLQKEQTTSSVSKSKSGAAITVSRFGDNGSIVATVPVSDPPVYMIVFNDDYKSDKIYANENGIIMLREILAGTYTVEFHMIPENETPRDYMPITYPRIKVYPGEITDLGIIEFQ